MYRIRQRLLLGLFCLLANAASAQTTFKGKIIDATTSEPLAGATVLCTKADCRCGCTTNAQGEFLMRCTDCQTVSVTSVGYQPQTVSVSPQTYLISLSSLSSPLQALVLSANRGEGARRSEAPVAITTISSKMMQDAKPAMLDQVLNKVSGVNMVNLGNEQHQMSIRQPMTTRSLFLYLEDGIPIRTTGLFNHNALLEINMAATRSIEVIKGPSSSLYGSEAIGGVVNFLSAAPTAVPVLTVSAQGNNVGYKRADFLGSATSGKWGFLLSSYYADKRKGALAYNDFHKGTLTARVDYHFSDKTTLSNRLTYLDYYSDMAGGIDSTMFARRTFTNLQTFTYRQVRTTRYHSTLSHVWNAASKTTVTALYRNNEIGQNPAYRVKDDYRKVNGIYSGKKDLAHGEINASRFSSSALLAQHRQNLAWKKAVLIAGLNADLSPSTYTANYIRIQKDTVTKKYTSYRAVDSTLTNYATDLNNYAAFVNVELSPVEKLRVVASLRYDFFHYQFDNHLKPSSFSGSPDTVNHFSRLSPKIGLTYNLSPRTGVYANYSEGFVPPQVTELYTGVKVPSLAPSVFFNTEVGGWMEIIRNKLSADVSAYRLQGTNEIISVKLDDGSYANQNAGRTLHRGIEAGINATPIRDLSFRFSGAFSKHEFVDFVEKGVRYNGNEMNNAPRWLYNAELWYKPSFAKGLRVGTEIQQVGRYFVDPQNTASYPGYCTLNLRAGYKFNGVDLWVNVLNATNSYYSTITTKSSFGYSYQLAEPLNVNVGVAYDFAHLFKSNQ